MSQAKHPLWQYVVSVIVVLAVLNGIASFTGAAKLKSMGVFSAGFLLGMLAMYIAVHLYRWK